MSKNLHSKNIVAIAVLVAILLAIPLYFRMSETILLSFAAVILSIAFIAVSLIWVVSRVPRSVSWAVALPRMLTAYFVLTFALYCIAYFVPMISMTMLVIAELVVIILAGIATIPVLGGFAEIVAVDDAVRTAKNFVDESMLTIGNLKGIYADADKILTGLYDPKFPTNYS